MNTVLEAIHPSSEPLTSFSVLLDENNDTIIQIVVNENYAGISSNKLTTSTVPEYFRTVPVSTEDSNSFHLIHNITQEYLVTPYNRPPVTFYLQSRYPDILEPAVFIFESVDSFVEEAYNSSALIQERH